MSAEDVMDHEWTDEELGIFNDPEMVSVPKRVIDLLFDRRWNGVVGKDCKYYWQMAGPYRHILARMVGETFEEAVMAAYKDIGE